MNIIEINNLNVQYENPVLKNINLIVKEGELISVIGPNGAGKSTLIKSICNILDSKKSIKICGKLKEEYSQKDLAKIISYVPQSGHRDFNFLAKDFILMGRYPYLKPFGSLTKEDYDACKKAMEITDTEKYADRLMTNLSGGERQKILLAASIAQEAKVLLLDEPTTFLDPKHISGVMKIVKKANEKSTVLMVTHELNTIGFSDRIVALKNGEIIFNDTPKEFYKEGVAKEIFDTDFYYMEKDGGIFIFPK